MKLLPSHRKALIHLVTWSETQHFAWLTATTKSQLITYLREGRVNESWFCWLEDDDGDADDGDDDALNPPQPPYKCGPSPPWKVWFFKGAPPPLDLIFQATKNGETAAPNTSKEEKTQLGYPSFRDKSRIPTNHQPGVFYTNLVNLLPKFCILNPEVLQLCGDLLGKHQPILDFLCPNFPSFKDESRNRIPWFRNWMFKITHLPTVIVSIP